LAVGKVLERLPANTRVFVVSDHGFCSELFEVRVNELLASAGLLTFKSPGSRKSIARFKDLKEKVARRLQSRGPNGNVLEKKVRYGSNFLHEIDWTRTRAFFAQDKGVWVNLIGREAEGSVVESDFDSVVENAREVLLGLTDPEDSSPIFESVLRREQAFRGLWSNRLPDLVMVPRRDEYVYNERPSYGDVIVRRILLRHAFA
jgi:predicted AlkP superfamily phosphohydrolase/phosphomutase